MFTVSLCYILPAVFSGGKDFEGKDRSGISGVAGDDGLDNAFSGYI